MSRRVVSRATTFRNSVVVGLSARALCLAVPGSASGTAGCVRPAVHDEPSTYAQRSDPSALLPTGPTSWRPDCSCERGGGSRHGPGSATDGCGLATALSPPGSSLTRSRLLRTPSGWPRSRCSPSGPQRPGRSSVDSRDRRGGWSRSTSTTRTPSSFASARRPMSELHATSAADSNAVSVFSCEHGLDRRVFTPEHRCHRGWSPGALRRPPASTGARGCTCRA